MNQVSFSVTRDDSVPVTTILYIGQSTAIAGPPRAVAVAGHVSGPGVP